MESAHEETYKEHEIIIKYGDYAENPREWDNLGKMVTSHKRYLSPNEINFDFDMAISFNDAIKQVTKKYNACVVLPIYMYDHSGVALSVQRTGQFTDRFDSGQYGFIFATKEDVRENFITKRITKKLLNKIEKILLDEVECFCNYLNGYVYDYDIIRNGEIIGSCNSFYEIEDAVEDAKSNIDYYIKQDQIENGVQLELELK